MWTLERAEMGWTVLVDGEVIGQLLPLLRGHGWRAGLTGERATGRWPTRLVAADALLAEHTARLASTT